MYKCLHIRLGLTYRHNNLLKIPWSSVTFAREYTAVHIGWCILLSSLTSEEVLLCERSVLPLLKDDTGLPCSLLTFLDARGFYLQNCHFGACKAESYVYILERAVQSNSKVFACTHRRYTDGAGEKLSGRRWKLDRFFKGMFLTN